MNGENAKPNNFVRALIVILAGFCGYLVFVSFKNGAPPYTISAAAFSTLVLMTVIVLSESFNNLSLGKILSLNRKVDEEKSAKEEVKKENSELRESLLKLSIAVRQTQTNTTINALPAELLKYLGVTKADESDKAEEEETAVSQPIKETTQRPLTAEPRETASRPSYATRRELASDALQRYFKKAGIPEADLSREVKFTTAFQNVDPITERTPVFDAYLKTPSREQFFEAMPYVGASNLDRIYVMLSKIFFYRQAKQIQAELTLIIPKVPESVGDRLLDARHGERLLQMFQPAISNNLLRVEFIEFSEAEYLAIAQKVSAE